MAFNNIYDKGHCINPLLLDPEKVYYINLNGILIAAKLMYCNIGSGYSSMRVSPVYKLANNSKLAISTYGRIELDGKEIDSLKIAVSKEDALAGIFSKFQNGRIYDSGSSLHQFAIKGLKEEFTKNGIDTRQMADGSCYWPVYYHINKVTLEQNVYERDCAIRAIPKVYGPTTITLSEFTLIPRVYNNDCPEKKVICYNKKEAEATFKSIAESRIVEFEEDKKMDPVIKEAIAELTAIQKNVKERIANLKKLNK